MSDIKRIILTQAHADHVQAANEVKKRTYVSSGVGAKIYSHWIDSAYLAHLILAYLIMAHLILEFTRSY